MEISRKILFGVTGIGYGHAYRQMPVIDYFARKNEIVVFAYDRSYDCYTERYRNLPDVHVEKIAVPFWAGGASGLDYAATARCPVNQDIDFLKINCRAMARAEDLIGRPDLVISDYEPVSAQYSYAFGSPLVTIDQQSKYLCGDFPPILGGFGFRDEISRLRMFFPKAEARLACSFFDFPRKPSALQVEVVPPVLRDSLVQESRRCAAKSSDILVYLSSAKKLSQPVEEIIGELAQVAGTNFHLFVPREPALRRAQGERVHCYLHGDPRFSSLLLRCGGIVTTAGHSLLSEAMFLGTPVYAVPVEPYEQHMNAAVIARNGFGVSEALITHDRIRSFIERLPRFAKAISNDREVLMRGAGQEAILAVLQKLMTAR